MTWQPSNNRWSTVSSMFRRNRSERNLRDDTSTIARESSSIDGNTSTPIGLIDLKRRLPSWIYASAFLIASFYCVAATGGLTPNVAQGRISNFWWQEHLNAALPEQVLSSAASISLTLLPVLALAVFAFDRWKALGQQVRIAGVALLGAYYSSLVIWILVLRHFLLAGMLGYSLGCALYGAWCLLGHFRPQELRAYPPGPNGLVHNAAMASTFLLLALGRSSPFSHTFEGRTPTESTSATFFTVLILGSLMIAFAGNCFPSQIRLWPKHSLSDDR